MLLNRACKWGKIQREALDSMTKAWPRGVPRWRKMLLAFKKDKSNPNPFEEPDLGMLFTYTCTLELNEPQVLL